MQYTLTNKYKSAENLYQNCYVSEFFPSSSSSSFDRFCYSCLSWVQHIAVLMCVSVSVCLFVFSYCRCWSDFFYLVFHYCYRFDIRFYFLLSYHFSFSHYLCMWHVLLSFLPLSLSILRSLSGFAVVLLLIVFYFLSFFFACVTAFFHSRMCVWNKCRCTNQYVDKNCV